jgi:hypothetical protein
VWTKKNVEELKADGCPDKNLPKAGKPKIQVFGFGTTIMKDLLDFYQDNVDLCDLDNGHDITIEREGKDINTDYRTRPSLKPSKAENITDEDLSEMWNLDQLMPFMTSEQQDLILAGGTKEDVYTLSSATTPESRQLSAGKKEKKEEPAKSEEVVENSTEEEASESEENEASESAEEEAVVEEEEVAEEAANSDTPDWPPLDKDDNIDYDQLSDEQIEDKTFVDVVDKDGFKVYVECFGKARQRNPKDEQCAENCGLFDRCGKRIAFLDEEEKKVKAAAAKKAPPGKKGPPGKPTVAAAEEAPAKKAPGKSPAPKEPESGGGALSLEEEMKKALKK